MFGSIDPSHNQPPLIETKPWGERILFTINLNGGTITPLINKKTMFGSIDPPHNYPPNKNKPWGERILFTINLDGGTITPS